jgi:hypothetical protein
MITEETWRAVQGRLYCPCTEEVHRGACIDSDDGVTTRGWLHPTRSRRPRSTRSSTAPGRGGQSHSHATLYILYRESLVKHTGRCQNNFGAQGWRRHADVREGLSNRAGVRLVSPAVLVAGSRSDFKIQLSIYGHSDE